MTSNRLVTLLRELTENQYTDSVLMMWLSNCENTVLTDVLLASPEDCVELTEPSDAKLIVPHPWDKLYLPYLQAQVAHANGEYDHYANYIALFNAYLEEYARHILETVQPAGGEAVTNGYYLSAYAIAVEHGYKGTVEQWLKSLIGPKGDTGATGPQGPKGDVGGTSLPIALANFPAGVSNDAYTATGDLLPVVSVANNPEQISAVGKGLQIVFIPYVANKTKSPTLQLNGGEVIPIRMRWYTNKGTNENAPEATTNVEVGSLMRGVPYTLTFCGKYWLVDSQIVQFDYTQAGKLRDIGNAFFGLAGSGYAGVPVSRQDGKIVNAKIVRSAGEDQAAQIKLPTEEKTKEMIRKDVTAEWEAYIASNEGGAPDDFAQTLEEGKYFFESVNESVYTLFKAYATVVMDSYSASIRKMVFLLTLYDDGVNYLYVYGNGHKLIETEIDFNGTGNIRLFREGNSYDVLTSKDIPRPTSEDNGKVLRVVDGKATWVSLPSASGVSF